MVPLSSNWYPFLDTLADSVNPMLAFAAIVLVLGKWRRSSRQVAALCAAATTLGLLGIYNVRLLNSAFSIWRQWGGHYSTHAAFATSLVISLTFWHPARNALLVGVLVAYLLLIVIMGYHGLADVLTSSVVGCLVTLPWQVKACRIASLRGALPHNKTTTPGRPPA
jgi:membrane-associated phospholipid phosphatase